MSRTVPHHDAFERLKDQLRFSRTGRFYKLQRSLTDAEHEALLARVVRAPLNKSMLKVAGLEEGALKVVRSAQLGPWHTAAGVAIDAYGTLVVQPVLEPAAVATGAGGLKELRFAHVLILEGAVLQGAAHGQWYGFVQTDILDDPLQASGWVTALSRAELLNPFLSPSVASSERARIEELNLRMMNLSRVGLRRKLLEAYDVEASVSSLGLHRTIPGTMRMRLPGSAGLGTSVTVSAARQSVRAGSSRVKLATLTQWFAQCVARLDAENGAAVLRNSLLAEMAEPLALLDSVEPSSLLLDFGALAEAGLGSHLQWQRADKTPAAWLDDAFLQAAFDDPIELTKLPAPAPAAATTAAAAAGAPSKASAAKATPGAPVRLYAGQINDGAGTAIAVQLEVEGGTCRLTVAEAGLLGSVQGPGVLLPFEQWVTRAKALRIAFDGGRVLYTAEGAHRSGNLTLAVQRLLVSIQGAKTLDAVTTEKGDDVLQASDTAFAATSCFHAIENDPTITATASTLVCGDAQDEVFDYLEIDAAAKRLRWLHAKVQRKTSLPSAASSAGVPPAKALKTMAQTRGSLSASSLQEVVGQAIKNLAFLRRDDTDPTFAEELQRWTEKCTLPKPSNITRLRRGSDPGGQVRTITQAATLQHEVAIVTPAYSRKKLVQEFGRIASGKAPQHAIQLFWLLSGFTHACLEVGVRPLIFVRD